MPAGAIWSSVHELRRGKENKTEKIEEKDHQEFPPYIPISRHLHYTVSHCHTA